MSKRARKSSDKEPESEEEVTTLRETFGNSPATWMEIEISADNQEVSLGGMSFGGDADLTAADVTRALADVFSIQHGIVEATIEQLASKAAEAPDSVVRGSVIAKGTLPVPGEVGRIEYPYQEGLEGNLSYPGLWKALTGDELPALLEADILTCLVAPDPRARRKGPPR